MDDLKLTKAQLAKIKLIKQDFYKFAKMNLYIKDKFANIVPFVPNEPQRALIDYVLLCISEKRPVKVIILKARQMGFSTAVEALCYWWTSTNFNINSVIIGNDEKSSLNLYRMFRRYFDNTNILFKPSVRYNTKSDLTFEKFDESGKQIGLGSAIKIETAKNKSAGRSDTINFLHGCMHPNSPIVLADGGSTTVRDAKVGDMVYTASGAIAPVKHKIYTGKKMTYRVQTWMSNEPVYLSADHKVLTTDGYKKVKDLTSKDWVRRPDFKFEEVHTIHHDYHTRPRKQGGGYQIHRSEDIKLDYDFGYLAGYYLAEGHISKSLNRVCFAYHKDEKYVDNVRKYFGHSYDTVRENRGISEFSDPFMATLLNRLCGRVETKHVPTFGNMEFFKGLLRGYLDGDGSKTAKDRVTVTSIHEKIARNINRIGDMIEHHPSLMMREAGYYYGRNCKKTYINVFNKTTNKPWIRKFKIVDGHMYVRVKKIEEYEFSDTYDIEIDHPDHNFETPIGVISNSEVATWESGEDLVASLMQTVPDAEVMDKPSMVFLESTAEGRGNYFHKEYVAAAEGKNNYQPAFAPWWILDTYERDATFDDLGELNDYELFLVDLMRNGHDTLGHHFPISEEAIPRKLAFYRRKAKDFAATPERLPQEYPSTWQEAFIASGKNVFNPLALQEMEKDATLLEDVDYYKITPLEDRPYEEFELEKVMFEPNETPDDFTYKAPLKIWEKPKPYREYVIGADVAEGLKGGDFSVATVVDISTMAVVARWRGHCDPDKFGEILGALGTYYNYALIGVEVNNHGLTTVQKLRDTFYTNLYKRDRGYDEEWETPTVNLGWKTDMRTKRLMIDDLIKLVRERVIKDEDIVFINEAFSYVRDERGRMNAEEGSHDDVVMSTAIAYQLFPWGDNDISNLKVVSTAKMHKITNG